MKNFDIEIIKDMTTKNGKIVRKTIRFKTKNGNKILLKDVEKYYKYLVTERNINPYDIGILGMSDMFRTLKNFENVDIQPYLDVEYYVDKPSKNKLAKLLTEYTYVEFTIRKKLSP